MKKLSDYIFYESWQLEKLGLSRGQEIIVVKDLCDLKAGEMVQFVGFDDVDNHFGIFVFTNTKGCVLEVCGDFSSSDHKRFKELKEALNIA